MIREVTGFPDDVEIIVLDVRRVDEVSRVALGMLRTVADRLAAAGRRLVTVDPEGLLDDAFPDGRVPVFGTLGSAVAHCEDELLARYAPDLPLPAVVPAVDSPVLAQLDPQDAAALVARMERRHFTDGEDRKSTRLNSSHVKISYAVFCLKKKKINK